MDIDLSKEICERIRIETGNSYIYGSMSKEEVEPLIEELLDIIDHLKEEIRNIEDDVRDNYHPIRKEDQYE